jgi:hypothetical protein
LRARTHGSRPGEYPVLQIASREQVAKARAAARRARTIADGAVAVARRAALRAAVQRCGYDPNNAGAATNRN